MLRASLFEYVLAETRGCLFVIYAVFLEYGECIGIEDFSPLVAVVSCGIASSEDVGECGAASSGRHIGKNVGFGRGCALHLKHIAVERGCDGVVCHVLKAEAELAQTEVAAVEV